MHSAATSTVRLCATLTLGRARASAAAIHLSSATHNGHRRHGTRKKIGLFTKANVHERKKTIDELVVPQTVRRPKNGVVLEFDGMENVSREAKGSKLDEFYRKPIMRQMAVENHMNSRLYQKAYTDFRSYCLDAPLDAALQVTFCDIINSNQSVDTLFPFFLTHAKKVFPHLESIDDLRLISDLTQPHNWYPEARTLHRKVVFHAGPTNSGKTYQALQRFTNSKSGVYCGPLKLLASEVFHKTNSLGVNCDLVTGEERLFATDNYHPSAHLSSTVEMLSTQMKVDVAVIDEIQMLRDEQRGWAWTRALLGVVADEVHLCGEKAAVPIVRELLDPIGEHVDVFEYERKSSLTVNTFGLGGFENIQDGDCIVCFSRAAIFDTTRKLEKRGVKPAVIYGDLPPGTKLAQAAKFNDPDDPTKVLVSTDAIGMGLNLNIQRVIFHSVTRPPNNELLPNYSALQIAGRAGRYGTAFDDGRAMTLKHEDIGILREILSQPVADIAKVGIAPTFDQIETFSFHLPHASFVNLLDIFTSLCSVTEKFFLCTVDQIKSLAVEIDNIQLPLKVRYTFCTAPINADDKPVAAAFKKIARRFSNGQPVTYEWLYSDLLQWPKEKPTVIAELSELESDYDITDLYLWLSLRYPDMFPEGDEVRAFSRQIDEYIEHGVDNIIELLENSLRRKKPVSVQKTTQSKTSEVSEADADVKSTTKRQGKRKSVMESVRNLLSPEELEELKQELRKADENSKANQEMNNTFLVLSMRGVRSLNSHHFPAPWPFVKKGAMGQRKIGPMVSEKHRWPGQNREFPELNPKFQKLNPEQLHGYTGVQPTGYNDPLTGQFVKIPEMTPELVVPDLAGFQLGPYVSYRADVEIEKRRSAYEQKVLEKGSEELADLYVAEDERWPPPKMDAKTMFDLFYADGVRKSYAEGQYGDIPQSERKKKSDDDA